MNKKELTQKELFNVMLGKLILEFLTNNKLTKEEMLSILEMRLFDLKFSIIMDSQPKLKKLLQTYEHEVNQFFSEEKDDDNRGDAV
jgi:hypothetical protein